MVQKNKKTILCNCYAAPGTGKSSISALVYGQLKQLKIDSELCREYAKDLVWEERSVEFTNQLSIMGKMVKKINALVGKVDVIVCDSPILLSAYYNQIYDKLLFNKLCKDTYNLYNNLDIFIHRTKPYNPNGRFQTEEESNQISSEIYDMLVNFGIDFCALNGDSNCSTEVIKKIGRKRPDLFGIDIKDYDSIFDAIQNLECSIEEKLS